ncbi:hypothetical protein BAE44_0001318, partial [Dichanthelium oligosanthes]
QFLEALKKTTCEVSSSRQKESETNFCPSDEVPLDYQHGKPFLYLWDLVEGPYEINKFHSWIMKAMKLGFGVVTANVPKTVYGHLHKLVIDFEDLHALYFYRMQYEDESKTGRYKVAYLNPQLINWTAHSFKMRGEVKAKLEEATTQEEKDIIIKQAHRCEKDKVRSI